MAVVVQNRKLTFCPLIHYYYYSKLNLVCDCPAAIFDAGANGGIPEWSDGSALVQFHRCGQSIFVETQPRIFEQTFLAKNICSNATLNVAVAIDHQTIVSISCLVHLRRDKDFMIFYKIKFR